MKINSRLIGESADVYIVAEMSANHNQDFDRAVKLIEAAKDAGADAIKLQTYTPDTITIDCDNEYFRIKGTIWEGKNLYELYGEAYTPWEWQPKLKTVADRLCIDFFSTPFDPTAVEFLEKMEVPAYKVASFEVVDIPLVKKIAQTGKPIIMSTGMATLAEIGEAVQAVRATGNNGLSLLKCTSAYPASPEDMNLRTIPHLAAAFNLPVGLSDHTLGISVPVAAVALEASIIEKHLTLSRNILGPDSSFSLEPNEFKEMVKAVRTTEKALGCVNYEPSDRERESRNYRRSLFVVENINAGECFTLKNIRSIRPGYGLAPREIEFVLGRKASRTISKGTPLSWKLIL